MTKWKEVPGKPVYQISEFGEVRRVLARGAAKNRLVKPYETKGGYLRVCLFVDGRKSNHFIHRLVALAFHGEPPSAAHHAAHRDGNPRNNFFENVTWLSPKENSADRDEHGRTAKGVRVGTSKLDDEKVRHIRASSEAGTLLARRYGVSEALISLVRLRRCWQHV